MREIGDYELLDEGREGGMGVVFRARQRRLNRIVALKMIRFSHRPLPSDLQRFRIEGEACAALRHENIVQVFEANEHQGQPFFSMAYIEGGDLRAELRKYEGKPLPLERAARLMISVARAVHHAHEHGLLHRDLKPGNILLDKSGKPYVTDFGLAKFVHRSADPSDASTVTDATAVADASPVFELTRPGQAMGSIGYSSPEQASGKTHELTTASDVYSLGAIFYRLITGQAPFPTDDWVDFVERASQGNFRSPSALNPQVDADLDAICRRCLEPDLKRRAGSAADLADQLDHWLKHEPLDPKWRKTPLWERSGKWVRRHPVPAGLVASILVCLILAGAAVHFRQLTREEAVRGRLAAAEGRFAPNDTSEALAEFAQILRQRLDERVAAERIVNTLRHRVFLLPTAATNPAGSVRVSSGRFADGEISPDHRLCVHGVGTNSITVRHCASGAIAWHIPRAHQLVIRDLRWSGDSRHFLSAGADKNAIIWDIATRTNLAPFEHPEPVYHAELNSTGTMLLTACRDKHARLWNVANGALIHRLPHSRSVASARFNGDGSLAVTVSDDGVVRIWDLSTGGLFSEPLRLVGWPGDARFTSDDKHVEVAMDDDTSRVFKIGRFFSHPAPDPSPGTEVQPLMTVESHGVRAMASGNIVELLNIRSGKGKLIHESTVNCVRFSSDGRRIATSTSGRRARVWDVHTGQALTDWLESKYPVPSIWFSSDDQWLLSSDNCWELHVMDGPAPPWLADLAEAVAGEKTGDRRVSGPATAIAFTRLGQRLAALPSTNRLVAWAKEFVSDDFETRPR